MLVRSRLTSRLQRGLVRYQSSAGQNGQQNHSTMAPIHTLASTRTPSTPRLRQTSLTAAAAASHPAHWLFRTNIPRRRGAPFPTDPRKRNFFGMAEVISVISNVCLHYITVRLMVLNERL